MTQQQSPPSSHETLDPITGFGSTPIPQVGKWSVDVLGDGFEAQLLELRPDEEGEVVATVVRHRPDLDPHILRGTARTPVFAALYIHGWNDYFFQRELAREVALAGGCFYAIDLRKYGRSWRAHQRFGWTDDLADYDEDIDAALSLISRDTNGLPVVLMAHSTGGLTAALWAAHHPGRLAGLWLNSPWLELQTSALTRAPMGHFVDLVAGRDTYRTLPTGGEGAYARTLTGWDPALGELPLSWQSFADDPAVTGWDINPVWKTGARDTLAGWLAAIIHGHREIATGVSIDCPTLVMTSTATYADDSVMTPAAYRSDSVLDTEVIADRAAHLGPHVTIAKFPGIHDLALSIPPVRRSVWSTTLQWLRWTVVAPQPRVRSTMLADETTEEFALRVPRPEDVQLAPR